MNNLIKKLTMIFILGFSFTASADDIEIIGSPTNANILFVMDLSGSMSWGKEENSTPTALDPSRLSALQGAFQSIVDNEEFDDMNFGLSVFSGDGKDDDRGKSVAHGIAYPVSPLLGDAQEILNKVGTNAYTHPGLLPNDSYMPGVPAGDRSREYLGLLSEDNTDIWKPDGKTPIVDALYEAAKYFRGQEAHWGKFPAEDIRSAHPSSYTGSLAYNTTVTTPARTEYQPDTRDDNTGGTNCNTNTGNTCTTSGTSCGLGTNCSEYEGTEDRWCDSSISTVSECLNANPTWHTCSTDDDTDCTTDTEEQTTCTTSTRVRCKETITKNRCDDPDTYSCDFLVDIPEVTETVVTGNAIYNSPIIDACSSNGIILLTDGEPTENASASYITNMIGDNVCDDTANTGIDLFGRCGPELAKYLATVDQVDGVIATPNIDDVQTVITHAVGLGLEASSPARGYLQKLVSDQYGSGGTFLEAATEQELTDAFTKLVNEIAGKARSFAAPSYSIDTSTLLSHGNSVYVPMFDKQGVVWPGNLKKFQLIDGELKDAAGDPATDADGILSTAKDMWFDSTVDPTDAITSGGAANKINPATRLSGKMKTNIGGSLVSLSNADNDDFGTGTTNAEKVDLLKYISGSNADDSARNHMGDIIHSKPIQLQFADTATVDGRKIIFVGSNEGFLHAINDSDGTEAFTFMPRELITNIKTQYNGIVQEEHTYGVDSPITLWIDESTSDLNKIGNGIVDADEEAYLFFGLRRGGKGYYALNVTNPDVPTLVWESSFGSGDSWSQPVVAQLKWGNHTEVNPVLVFGGGHQDDDNTIGNAVYIVNALDIENHADSGGDVVWSTKIAEANTQLAPDSIDNGVPSRIRVLDVDANGSIDRLYFGDTGGNIWRADLDAGKYGTPADGFDIAKATLHKFAELGGTTPKRKFFEEPSVAIFKYSGKTIASIAIGSGDRPNPLDSSISDKFFVLYDKEVLSEVTQTTINFSELTDIITSPLTATHNVLDSTFKGWYRSLSSTSGEKVLSTAVTYQNKVIFTTFGISTSTTTDACQTLNEARLYILDLNSGVEYENVKASTGEILGTPQLIFPPIDDTNCTAGSCEREPVQVCAGYCGPDNMPVEVDGIDDTEIPNTLERIYWIDSE